LMLFLHNRPSIRVTIPGGSGQVGRLLASYFHAQGDDVTVIARNPTTAPWRSLIWDGRTLGAWTEAIDGANVIINLAGRSVNCRYNSDNRRIIKESRTETTRLVGQAIAAAKQPPTLWMNASTATIYRHAFDRPMDEATGELGGAEPDVPDTWRFSIDVAKSWEEAFFKSSTSRTRKIALRSAIVMSPSRGGAFDILLGLVRRGLGGASGDGKQFVSWIHDEDFVRAVEFLIGREQTQGVVNVSSPNPLPNREFMRALREAWGTRIGIPATAWILELGAFVAGSETELILKSRRVIPGYLMDAGFKFRFPRWAEAAVDLVRRWQAASEGLLVP
ncbi:MAG TPA: TIGR01777 family oxidoreductase, partial [Candidatus Eremiobacteraceae bacterium]|nr:TIGR01777 family oxidoreductase [Candidatus Eremiobacteraceae bacterium]